MITGVKFCKILNFIEESSYYHRRKKTKKSEKNRTKNQEKRKIRVTKLMEKKLKIVKKQYLNCNHMMKQDIFWGNYFFSRCFWEKIEIINNTKHIKKMLNSVFFLFYQSSTEKKKYQNRKKCSLLGEGSVKFSKFHGSFAQEWAFFAILVIFFFCERSIKQEKNKIWHKIYLLRKRRYFW